MKSENLERAISLRNQYQDVSRFVEKIISDDEETVAILFPKLSAEVGSVFFSIKRDTAETLLFTEQNRLERELAGLGVDV